MENKTIAQQLADNLNRNVLIDHILDMSRDELENHLDALTLDTLREIADIPNSIKPDKT